MCNYDYTPYKGCTEGEQHYYIQWIKCGIAAENGRYCSLETSTRLEKIREISGNVLACPLHGPVAVQQFILDGASPRHHDEDEKRRARSASRRSATSRGRSTRRGSALADDEDTRREIRRQRSRQEVAQEEASDSESGVRENRARLARRASRRAEAERADGQSKPSRKVSHRRSMSADLDPIPPVPQLNPRYGRSETSLPLEAEPEPRKELRRSSTASSSLRQQQAPEVPKAPSVVGLPSSPDMHRRASLQKARAEAGLKDDFSPLPSPKSWTSQASDSSPDQDPTLPFTYNRRARRTARSIGDRSIDTSMQRIDENVAADEPPLSPRSLPPLPGPAPARSPPPEPTNGLHYPSRHARTANRPQLNSLTIPKPGDKYQREYYSAPTATPPDTEITNGSSSSQSRPRSLRSVDAVLGAAQQSTQDSSSSNLAPTAARGSVDSGYLSGHSKNGRNTLQKSPAQKQAAQVQAQQAQEQNETKSQQTESQSSAQQTQQPKTSTDSSRPQDQQQRQDEKKGSPHHKPRPAPLNLVQPGTNRLPPCALPVSLISPSAQSDPETTTSPNKGGRATILQRMGLKRKISGLLDKDHRGGRAEVGVKG
ncbi:hypothetical protein VTJ04DRAFT_5824 [Mycothermus thermophilus]|uniref:uncharacterized protein n=1 Tax=Humicola insolens TaxID=85995 RepID=UPI003742E177